MVYHHHVMRTTVDIPDHLLAEAEQLAAEGHLPLTRLLEDSLRFYLSEQRMRSDEFEELASAWERETKHLPSLTQIVLNPHY